MSTKNTKHLSRRRVLQAAAAASIATFGLPMLNLGSYRAFGANGPKYSSRAMKLIERSLVIDMLSPLKLDFTPEAYSHPVSEQAAAEFRASGINAFHNAIGTGADETLPYITAWQGYAGRNAHVFSLVGTAPDLDRAKKERKIAVVIGVQNSAHFRKVEDVKMFYQLGQRVSQLTYNNQNLIGSGSTDRAGGGISDYGEQIIKAMNEVGMLVDVSHCGPKTTLDAIEISPKPIAFTHSNCRALNDHPRLKTDEAILKLAAKGGVMGITGVRNFVTAQEPTTIEDIVNHVDHVVKLVGIEHVGVGSDADLNGYDDMPRDQLEGMIKRLSSSYRFRGKLDVEGFDHPRKIFDLTEALIRRGYSDANIVAILGGNFRRLLGGTWA